MCANVCATMKCDALLCHFLKKYSYFPPSEKHPTSMCHLCVKDMQEVICQNVKKFAVYQFSTAETKLQRHFDSGHSKHYDKHMVHLEIINK